MHYIVIPSQSGYSNTMAATTNSHNSSNNNNNTSSSNTSTVPSRVPPMAAPPPIQPLASSSSSSSAFTANLNNAAVISLSSESSTNSANSSAASSQASIVNIHQQFQQSQSQLQPSSAPSFQTVPQGSNSSSCSIYSNTNSNSNLNSAQSVAVAVAVPTSSSTPFMTNMSSNGGGMPGFHGIGHGNMNSNINNNATNMNSNNLHSNLTNSTAIAGLPNLQNLGPLLLHPLNQLHNLNSNTTTTGGISSANSLTSGSVPEFLYQLTKMLTEHTNHHIIEWSTLGRIEVHNPTRLASDVLHKYFRHSKYSSFQRQLNYFGFRKIAGKGKMSPCSYINDGATSDIRSLLLIKRKTSEKEKEKEREKARLLLLQQQEENGSGGGGQHDAILQNDHGDADVASTATTSKKAHRPKRINPGNDIQPVTVKPMFASEYATIPTTTSSMTASAPMSMQTTTNYATIGNENEITTTNMVNVNNPIMNDNTATTTATNNNNMSNKRPKLEYTNQGIAAAGGIHDVKYTVAIGKGVRHLLNGYLRDNSNHNNATPATASTINNNINNNNNNKFSYLSHPSSKVAAMAPAPLQFLDPSELGMSIETSLSQLKDNFRNATNSYNSVGGVGSSGVGGVGGGNGNGTAQAHLTNGGAFNTNNASLSASSSQSSHNNNNNNTNVTFDINEIVDPLNELPSSPNNNNSNNIGGNTMKKIISTNSFAGGFLSHNSSLIDLAMLPTLDTMDAAMAHFSNSGSTSSAVGGVDDAGGTMHNGMANNNSCNSNNNSDNGHANYHEESPSDDGTFNFIDFPNQSDYSQS